MEKTEELNNKMFELLNKYHITDNEINEIKTLIEQGADVNARDKESSTTPLMYACQFSNDISLKLVKYLIKRGANVNETTLTGYSVLMNASERSDADIYEYGINSFQLHCIQLLIDNGADVNAKDENGKTPLIYACLHRCESIEIARLLLNNGADVNAKDENGKTALDYASKLEYEDIAKMLMDNIENQQKKLHFAKR